jgi:hypothetical protein
MILPEGDTSLRLPEEVIEESQMLSSGRRGLSASFSGSKRLRPDKQFVPRGYHAYLYQVNI